MPNTSPAAIARTVRGMNSRLATRWRARNTSGAAGCAAIAAETACGSNRPRSTHAATTPPASSSRTTIRPARRALFMARARRGGASGKFARPRRRASDASSGRPPRRISHITPQEIDDADPQPVEDAVIRLPALARPVVDRDRHGRAALAHHQRRQEAVVVIEERQIEIELAPHDLEAAAGVGRGVAEEPRAHRVGDARGPALGRSCRGALRAGPRSAPAARAAPRARSRRGAGCRRDRSGRRRRASRSTARAPP